MLLPERRAAATVVLLAGGGFSPATATSPQGPEPPAVLRVSVTAAPVHLDGHLNELAWATADSIAGLRQRDPVEGAPASQRTVVKVLRDQAALYIGVRAWDSNVARLRATQLRRDADLSSDDNIRLIIDSYHDRRGAFAFATNPNGVMWDAQLTGFEDVNADWNGIWDVAVTRDADGWTAEFRIPWRTLRFHQRHELRFGFNVRRFIRRDNEEDLWQAWGRTEGAYQLLKAGELAELGDPERGRDLDVYAYGLGRAVEPPHDPSGARVGDGALEAKAGVDAKLALSPTLTADLTFNTDFAQVEADQQVINLTRFPLFFPEKREFFLESSGQFGFGSSGITQAFYSRRIGLDTAGNPVPIVAGGRMYGRAGPWRIGLLGARTGGGDDATDGVVRLQHDLFDRSFIGLVGTARNTTGPAGGTQATGGLDIDLPLIVQGRNVEPRFWIMGSTTPGVAGFPLAWRLSTDYPNDLFDNFVSVYSIAAGFDPALGFVRRTGIWEATGHVDFMPRPHTLGIRQLDLKFPIPSWDIIADRTGSLAKDGDWQTAQFEWRPFGGAMESGDEFEVNVQRLLDAPTDTFDLFRGVRVAPGRYWWWRYELQYATSSAHALSAKAQINWGGFYGGRSTDLEIEGTWRGGGHAIVGASLAHTAASLPGGDFTAIQATGRIEYAFDTRAGLLGLVQYVNDDQELNFNLRFHWIPAIGDDVFLVWTSGYTTNPAAPYRFPATRALTRPLSGALVAKVVHRFAP
jgi:hypothetical protein